MNEKDEIRKNVIIIACDHLIKDYTNALESDQNLDEEEIELAINMIQEAKNIIDDYNKTEEERPIQRPSWKHQ